MSTKNTGLSRDMRKKANSNSQLKTGKRTGYGLKLFSADNPVLYLSLPNAELNFTYTDPLTITWSCQKDTWIRDAIRAVLEDGRQLEISQSTQSTIMYDRQMVPICEPNQNVPNLCIKVGSFDVSFNVSLYTQKVLNRSLKDVIRTSKKHHTWVKGKKKKMLEICSKKAKGRPASRKGSKMA